MDNENTLFNFDHIEGLVMDVLAENANELADILSETRLNTVIVEEEPSLF